MDLATTIIGLVMLGAFVVPIVIMSKKSSNKNKAILIQLKEFAAQNNCKISEYDVNDQFALGLSKQKDQVFFIQKPGHDDIYINNSIRLNEVKNCVLQTTKHTDKSHKNTESEIDTLDLCIHGKSKENSNIIWPLYNSQVTPQPDNEVQLAKKWISIIKSTN